MKTYQIQEFLYPRDTTDAWIRFVVCGETWEFPAQVVADDRDKHYAAEEEDTVKFIREGRLDLYDLLDWAVSNMNWSDVKDYARRVEEARAITDEDFQDAWLSAEKTVHGTV